MRDNVPLRWIENAEAKQVLAAALFEQASTQSWCEAGREAIAHWLPRVGSWMAPPPRTEWPPLAAQPALIRRTACRHVHRQTEDTGYSCDW